MDVIRRNTDYALRAMVHMAENYGKGYVSAKVLAKKEDISYQLVCKLLQRLHRGGFVKSLMGPSGGYTLARNPSEITLASVVDVLQGPVTINRCVGNDESCQRKSTCAVSSSLQKIQRTLDEYMEKVTLEQLLKENKDSE
jgi:Rrf2 family iron-sulfur cluster assembly transcriptional regulator